MSPLHSSGPVGCGRLPSWESARPVAALVTIPPGREQQRGVGCADCCSAEPGRRVVPRRPFAECRGAESEQARGRRDARYCFARRTQAAVAHRDGVAVLAPADFCAVGLVQQSRAAHDAAGARHTSWARSRPTRASAAPGEAAAARQDDPHGGGPVISTTRGLMSIATLARCEARPDPPAVSE
jgi:hypothetical protein